MASSFRALIQSWADDCELLGRDKIIACAPHGTLAESQQEARRVVVAFASMRAAERKRVEARARAAGESAPLSTPYENIVCRMRRSESREGFDVLFICTDGTDFLANTYVEIEEGASEGRG